MRYKPPRRVSPEPASHGNMLAEAQFAPELQWRARQLAVSSYTELVLGPNHRERRDSSSGFSSSRPVFVETLIHETWRPRVPQEQSRRRASIRTGMFVVPTAPVAAPMVAPAVESTAPPTAVGVAPAADVEQTTVTEISGSELASPRGDGSQHATLPLVAEDLSRGAPEVTSTNDSFTVRDL